MPRSPCLADKAPDMQAIRFQNSARGTRNLAIGISESSSCNPESTAWNLQSKDYHMKVGVDPPGIILFQFYGSWLGTVKIFEPDKYI